MGMAGVCLVGFAMFLAYLYSVGKIQAVWNDVFGAPAATTPNNNSTAPAISPVSTTGATPGTGVGQVVAITPGTVNVPTSPVQVAAATPTDLSFPQVSVT